MAAGGGGGSGGGSGGGGWGLGRLGWRPGRRRARGGGGWWWARRGWWWWWWAAAAAGTERRREEGAARGGREQLAAAQRRRGWRRAGKSGWGRVGPDVLFLFRFHATPRAAVGIGPAVGIDFSFFFLFSPFFITLTKFI